MRSEWDRQVHSQTLRNSPIEFELHPVILECEESENIRRMRNDNRDEKRIERAITHSRFIYDELDYPRINTTDLTVTETMNRILEQVNVYPTAPRT